MRRVTVDTEGEEFFLSSLSLLCLVQIRERKEKEKEEREKESEEEEEKGKRQKAGISCLQERKARVSQREWTRDADGAKMRLYLR